MHPSLRGVCNKLINMNDIYTANQTPAYVDSWTYNATVYSDYNYNYYIN